ncbi:unnamed protein product [Pseudo-nitzschia multistriata]|uniref:Uncharacterized protein n=1 Tax=Pseudo-nitzschia multistriata TaxID=183589 RepID=A0A448Z316_9STRA|nr:unnamed protein product [Pseudo-nitzschia multistriata]
MAALPTGSGTSGCDGGGGAPVPALPPLPASRRRRGAGFCRLVRRRATSAWFWFCLSLCLATALASAAAEGDLPRHGERTGTGTGTTRGSISISSTTTSSTAKPPRMSVANMTCRFFEQPLNHFLPRGRSPSYSERYCVYDGYLADREASTGSGGGDTERGDPTAPIFFYTGNESPLEQYINQTGLMWELAPRFGAKIVFAEHRYEGESLPANLTTDCLSYASTIQALEDYARLLEEEVDPGHRSPVVVFGGSYGGMLSAWMRMKYPHLVAGAIAASAPIGAFPQNADSKIDSSARVLANGIDRPYPPTANHRGGEATVPDRHKGPYLQGTTQKQERRLVAPAAVAAAARTKDQPPGQQHRLPPPKRGAGENHCRDNLLASWPLLSWLAKQQEKDRSIERLLQTAFSMCDPLPSSDAGPLIRWAQRVWFDLAEGSFPYPSSYIPFALLHKKVDLPPWPTQDACWKSSELHKDWGVRFHGSREDVNYRISYGDSGISLQVDWDSVTLVGNENGYEKQGPSAIEESADVVGLLTSVRDAVSIWYNITKDVPCYNISQAAPNARTMRRTRTGTKLPLLSPSPPVEGYARDAYGDPFGLTEAIGSKTVDPERICHEAMVEQGSWGLLCCNDEMNLVITDAQGTGHDFFWPPSHPRSVKTYRDMIRNSTFEPCADPYGIYGYSKEPIDPMSMRLDAYYGGSNTKGHSNIVFSNGLLDPWSAGGVYRDSVRLEEFFDEDKAKVQKINENDVVALIIPFGGHHTDLMYSDDSDPNSVTEGRKIEEEYIERWIRDWKP